MVSPGYLALKLFLKPLSLLPLSTLRKLGEGIGRFLGSVVKYRRDVVMVNLSRSFPQMKYWDLDTVCDDFYRHFGRVVAETLWFGSCDAEKLRKSGIVRMENPEILNKAVADGKSVFVMTSHMGNWELMGGYLCYSPDICLKQENVCVVYKEQASGAFQKFMAENRMAPVEDKKSFDGMVETYSILRHAIRNRHKSIVYNFIMDQHPYTDASKVKVDDFMHQETFSMDGAPALAAKFHMPAVYLGMTEDENHNYIWRYEIIAEDASQMSELEILNNYYKLLQRDLEAQPWNYLWTHKRWKI